MHKILNFRSILVFFFKILNAITPKKNIMIFYSTPDFSDNSLAFCQYVTTYHGDDWKCVWIATDTDYAQRIANSESVTNCQIIGEYSIKALFYSLIAKVQLDTHGARYYKFKFSKFPLVISLWHGSPIKKIGRDTGACFISNKDWLCSGSDYFVPFLKNAISHDNTKILTVGYPRNDWLNGNLDTSFNVENEIKPYVIWMPTFKKSRDGKFNDGEVELGGISFLSSDELCELDDELICYGLNLYIKLHPFDVLNEFDFKSLNLKNVVFIKSDDEIATGSKLYGLLRHSLALISDYSSVIFDYIYTDKPIGVDIYSCDLYTRSRYFDYANAHFNRFEINSKNTLLSFLSNIISGEVKEIKVDSKYILNYPQSKKSFSELLYCKIVDYIA
ncbi:CDP-glycerol glycerophosphotransferase family protein [Aeromonas veronii]